MPKRPEARFSVGLVGVGQIAKDPRWALEVLRLLRARDPRYRLFVMGGGMSPEHSAASRAYHELLSVTSASWNRAARSGGWGTWPTCRKR